MVGDPSAFDIHTTQATVDYELSPDWTFSGGGGIVFLQATAETAAKTGPAWRARLDRLHGRSLLHLGPPSCGEAAGDREKFFWDCVASRPELFGSRHFYLDNSLVFRDDQPLCDPGQLPLRSLRTYSTFGWATAVGAVRSLLLAGPADQPARRQPDGQRNRIGFQIVTSKPMRMQ